MSNPRFDIAKRESFLLKKIPQNFRAAQKYTFIFIKILISPHKSLSTSICNDKSPISCSKNYAEIYYFSPIHKAFSLAINK